MLYTISDKDNKILWKTFHHTTSYGQAAQSGASLVPLFGAGKSGRAAAQVDEVFGGSEDAASDSLAKTVAEGGTGKNRAERLLTLKDYNFTPKEIREIKRSDDVVLAFKELIEGQDPRFADLQTPFLISNAVALFTIIYCELLVSFA